MLADHRQLPDDKEKTFAIAAIWGLTYLGVDMLGHVLDNWGGRVRRRTWRGGGLGAFLYLEVLDASFSFDGVIGAFALTQNLFLIAIGLGIGAMYVRAMTVMLVERGTLAEFRYLENGAFWSILILSILMFAQTLRPIPGRHRQLLGAGFIGVASSARWHGGGGTATAPNSEKAAPIPARPQPSSMFKYPCRPRHRPGGADQATLPKWSRRQKQPVAHLGCRPAARSRPRPGRDRRQASRSPRATAARLDQAAVQRRQRQRLEPSMSRPSGLRPRARRSGFPAGCQRRPRGNSPARSTGSSRPQRNVRDAGDPHWPSCTDRLAPTPWPVPWL